MCHILFGYVIEGITCNTLDQGIFIGAIMVAAIQASFVAGFKLYKRKANRSSALPHFVDQNGSGDETKDSAKA
jgi:hypothetical protein